MINNILSNTFIESNRIKQTNTKKGFSNSKNSKFSDYSWLYELIGELKKENFSTKHTKKILNVITMSKIPFTGIVILSITSENIFTILDQTMFLRFKFVIEMTRPNLAARKLLWKQIIPKKTPVGELKFDELASAELSGRNSRSRPQGLSKLSLRDSMVQVKSNWAILVLTVLVNLSWLKVVPWVKIDHAIA